MNIENRLYINLSFEQMLYFLNAAMLLNINVSDFINFNQIT